MLDHIFQNPPDECRGTDFWMLNDTLDEGEMRRQLRSMRAQGVACVIVRTYIGLRSDYPGPDWMGKMRAVVDEAKSLDMKLFMQAGYMPEAVLDLPPEYSLGDVRCCAAGQGEGQVLDSHDGIDYCLVPSMTILDMLSPDACAFYVRQSYENMWKDFRDEFGKTIVSMWVDEPSFAKVSLPWTGILPQTYAELWGEAFPMDRLHLLFVDGEGDREIRLKYWRTVLHLMKNAYFQSVRDWAGANHIRFSGHLMMEDTMETQIRATCFTMPMYKYFDIPGIDYLTDQQDWIHGEIKPEKPYETEWAHYGRYNTPLQCSSAAHQAGKKVILAEMYGVSTENLGLRDQKQIFDHFASLGINHRSVHGLFYSLRGRGKRAFPPHVHDYQPYWPTYHILTDAIARETAFVRAGEPVRDILLIHPMETGFSLYHGKGKDGQQDNTLLRRLDGRFNQTLRTLVGMQANFELGDEDTIAEMGRVSEEGEFVVGQMAYRAVILPDMEYMREGTLRLLRAFAEKGGRVLALGTKRVHIDRGGTAELSAIDGITLADSAREMTDFVAAAPSTYKFTERDGGTGVQILCRRDGKDYLFFITNANCREGAAGELSLPGRYACARYEEMDGSVTAYGGEYDDAATTVRVDLPAGGTVMLRFTPGECVAVETAAAQASLPITRGWRFHREDPNALVLEMYRYACQGQEMSRETYPILAIQDRLLKAGYRGEVTLETRFRLDKPISGLRLAVEYPREQSIFVDGKEICHDPVGQYICFAFETLPLPDLSQGEHVLTIRRHFEPRRKARSSVTSLFENLGGVDLEQAILIGDFAARSALEPAVRGCVRMSDDFVLTGEDSECGQEIVCRGYPFYAGVMAMDTEIDIPAGAKEAYLTVEGLHAAAAEVRLNGEICGTLCWAPYRVPLTGAHPGKNTLTIRLYGTLRNLLGPWHRPVGEIGACWGGYGSPNRPWEGSYAHENGQLCPNWEENRRPDKLGWTESYLCLPLGIVGPAISWKV